MWWHYLSIGDFGCNCMYDIWKCHTYTWKLTLNYRVTVKKKLCLVLKLMAIMIKIYSGIQLSIHPSIHPLWFGLCGKKAQKRGRPPPQPHLPPPKAFSGQVGYFIPLVCSGSAGSPPSWTCPENIQGGVPGASSSDGWTTSTGSVQHKGTFAQNSSLCSYDSVILRKELLLATCIINFIISLTIGKTWNVDQWLVKWERHQRRFRTQTPHSESVSCCCVTCVSSLPPH